MVNRTLLRNLDDESLEADISGFLSEFNDEIYSQAAAVDGTDVDVNAIVEGTVIRVDNEFALIDVGFKSEGSIPLNEWDDEERPQVGDTFKVLIEDVEDELGRTDDPYGMVSLSKRKAEKIIIWQEMMKTVSEGQVVTGRVTRKIKGGLLVDIGVNVFLPASQVDIRRPHDIGDYIGRVVQCDVLKIDEARRNIVVSRRALIERQREMDREELMAELQEGQRRKGVVKNIADFGAFVDLGGIDGLLHITDMSWGRIGHPTELVAIDQEIEVMVLHIDHEKQKIALGLKQMLRSPWEDVADKYPVDSRIMGEVVNVMSYGAFVKLEEGIEGLVHISEMSWTRRVSHPSELVGIGDEVEIVVLKIDQKKQEISLGMKQTQDNPWDQVAEKYSIDSKIKGKVRNLTNYGAFIELEEGIDGLLHVSDMSWTRKVGHPSEILEKGQDVECKVLSVDQNRRRIALGLKQLSDDPWETTIPEKYQPNQLVTGEVTKITNFGVFVRLEDGLEGLLHISELADYKVENPEDIVKVGEQLEVKILRVDTDDRKIGLSRKRVEWAEEDEAGEAVEESATAGATDASAASLKGGLGSSGPLIQPAESEAEEDAESAEEDNESSEEERSEEAVAEPTAEDDAESDAEKKKESSEEGVAEPAVVADSGDSADDDESDG